MKNILLLLLVLLFSCASQGYPTGGPIDEEGPIILKFSNKNREPPNIFNTHREQQELFKGIKTESPFREVKSLNSPNLYWLSLLM